MFSPLPTPEEMAGWDKLCIDEFGLSGKILMENASRGALQVLKEQFGSLRGRYGVVVAGAGHNGGDGFALARHLWNLGARIIILHTKPRDVYTGDTAYHLGLAERMDIPCFYLPEYEADFLNRLDFIVDGLLGTGFKGPLRPEFQTWIKRINKLGKNSFVLALDIPSGINGETGEPSPIAVRANATVSFEEAKLGLFLPPASDFIGKLTVVKIGVPAFIKQDHPTSHMALTGNLVSRIRTPTPTMHKGEAGHLLILGGSPGLTGAPLLAGLAGLRSGSGLVTIGCPKGLSQEIKAGWPDIMTLPLGDGELWDETCFEGLADHLSRFSTVVVGPGLGRRPGVHAFLKEYIKSPHLNTIYDADALYFLAMYPELMDLLDENAVLTPHPGEMARFFNVSPADINNTRAQFARQFSQQHRLTVILKGAGTVISGLDNPVYISPFATPNLALGGSGDVLSGIIGSLMAQGHDSLSAAQIAVYWHGLAGAALQKTFPYRGNTAQEIAQILPEVLKEWKNEEGQRHYDANPLRCCTGNRNS